MYTAVQADLNMNPLASELIASGMSGCRWKLPTIKMAASGQPN